MLPASRGTNPLLSSSPPDLIAEIQPIQGFRRWNLFQFADIYIFWGYIYIYIYVFLIVTIKDWVGRVRIIASVKFLPDNRKVSLLCLAGREKLRNVGGYPRGGYVCIFFFDKTVFSLGEGKGLFLGEESKWKKIGSIPRSLFGYRYVTPLVISRRKPFRNFPIRPLSQRPPLSNSPIGIESAR